jgi:hypothetical protein
MPSAAEVAELRQAGQAQSLDHADHTLRTDAEVIGFLTHTARAMGADQAEQLDWVELVVRATGMWRENIREARDVLVRLGYGRDLAMLLTKLARKAKPKPQWSDQWRSRAQVNEGAQRDALPSAIRPISEAALALELLRPKRKSGR